MPPFTGDGSGCGRSGLLKTHESLRPGSLESIVTIPYKIMTQMRFQQKTEERIAEFDRAWQEFKQVEKTD